MAAQLELDFNSVERIVEYLDVPQEAPSIIEKNRPPAYWPSSNGELVVDNLVVQYASGLPPVLRNLSFTIRPAEKVGVVSDSAIGAHYVCHSEFEIFRWEGRDLVSITNMCLPFLSI